MHVCLMRRAERRRGGAFLAGVEGGMRRFKYVWSSSYRQQQRLFQQCQASHDPNAIAALLQHAP